MNTETLRTFIAAAQIKNFTKTAEHLFIAQSTVTNRIFDLESEIGKPLFTRKHKQIELTEAGLQFLDYANNSSIWKQRPYKQSALPFRPTNACVSVRPTLFTSAACNTL